MSTLHRQPRTPAGDRKEFVVGETKREDVASPSDIEIRSGGGSILDESVYMGFEEIRDYVVEDLRQEIAALRRATR
ncbi:hypothetical protein [Pseudarthrobacter enclensis]|uniref:hypothetical protein n=1 Tax=Pseudarthrobacter enclensis TaxID=993070 RepID=UPI0027D86CC4|nr:hypothetical protein [Pseudarthrobacter enclensis]